MCSLFARRFFIEVFVGSGVGDEGGGLDIFATGRCAVVDEEDEKETRRTGDIMMEEEERGCGRPRP
jgi:hypothetical protein